MADGSFYLTRAAVKARVEGSSNGGGGGALSITAGRCYLGWKEVNITEKDAYDEAKDNGPFALMGLTSSDIEWTHVGPMGFSIDIYIAKDKSASWTGQDVENLLQDVIARILTQSAYTAGAHSPMKALVTGYDYDVENTPGLLVVHMRCEALDPPASEHSGFVHLKEGLTCQPSR